MRDIYKNHKSETSVKAMKKREKEMIKALEKYMKTMSKNGKEKSGITKEWIEETLD